MGGYPDFFLDNPLMKGFGRLIDRDTIGFKKLQEKDIFYLGKEISMLRQACCLKKN